MNDFNVGKIIKGATAAYKDLHVPKNKAEYGQLGELADALEKEHERTDSDAILHVLFHVAKLRNAYDKIPQPEPYSPHELLQILMDDHKLIQADLVDIFGGQGNVSAALSGRRPIGVDHAKQLGERFQVRPELFLGLR